MSSGIGRRSGDRDDTADTRDVLPDDPLDPSPQGDRGHRAAVTGSEEPDRHDAVGDPDEFDVAAVEPDRRPDLLKGAAHLFLHDVPILNLIGRPRQARRCAAPAARAYERIEN